MSSFPVGTETAEHVDACDVFAQLLPLLHRPDVCPSRRRRAIWKLDRGFVKKMETVRDLVVKRGKVPAALANYFLTALRSGDDPAGSSQDAFALLLGIDRAFAGLRPFASDDHDALDPYREQLWQHNRLDSGTADPALVLPRRGGHLRAPLEPEDLLGEFEYLLFISDGREVDYAVVHPQQDMSIQALREKTDVKIACVPFLGSYDELKISSKPYVKGVKCYQIQPNKIIAQWGARIDRVLAKIESEDVDFVVLPELALSDGLLALWQDRLRQRSNAGRPNPRWILAGTGAVGKPQKGEFPPNRAVLLWCDDRSTVMEQDKMRPFDMTAGTVARWKLDVYLGNTDHREGMREGQIRRIRDLRAGRVAIFICEDHGRPIQEVSRIAQHEPTLIFVPIFSEPIRRFFWEDKNALEEVTTMGASVIVANSCAVPVPVETDPAKRLTQEQYGICLGVWPVEKTFGYLTAEKSMPRFPDNPDPEGITYFRVPLS